MYSISYKGAPFVVTIDSSVAPPSQIEPSPLSVAIGSELIVITIFSSICLKQFAPVIELIVMLEGSVAIKVKSPVWKLITVLVFAPLKV